MEGVQFTPAWRNRTSLQPPRGVKGLPHVGDSGSPERRSVRCGERAGSAAMSAVRPLRERVRRWAVPAHSRSQAFASGLRGNQDRHQPKKRQ